MECYVHTSVNINVKLFEDMLEEYYSREKEYKYSEIKKWCDLRHTWYNVVAGGKRIPLIVNKSGIFAERETKGLSNIQ